MSPAEEPRPESGEEFNDDDFIIILPDEGELASEGAEPPPAAPPASRTPASADPSRKESSGEPEIEARRPGSPIPETTSASPSKPPATPGPGQSPAPDTAPGRPSRPRARIVPAPSAARRSQELGAELEGEIESELRLGAQVYEAFFSKPWPLRVLGALAAGGLLTLLAVGWNYYATPVHLRPLHHLHEALRPSSPLGLGLGIGGAGLMLASMSYVIRKHLLSPGKRGSLQAWMGFHILTGFLGPAVVLFHAAFIPRSALGLLAFSAMLIVVVSGVVGRYILVQLPRSVEGRDLELPEIQNRLKAYRSELLAHYVAPDLLRLSVERSRRREWFWLYYALTGIVLGDRQSRRDYEKMIATIDPGARTRDSGQRLLVIARKFCRERQWLFRYRELKRLMNAWRFFHQWMAIVLAAAVVFHVIVALLFGKLI